LLCSSSFLLVAKQQPNGAADKLQPPKGVVSFIRWMGGRERSEQRPPADVIRRLDGWTQAKRSVAKRPPIYEISGIYSA